MDHSIQTVFMTSGETYGTRRKKRQIEKQSEVVISRRRIGRVMSRLGLNACNKKPLKVLTTDSNHNYAITP